MDALKIPCPVCGGTIEADAKALLMGSSFACPDCNAVVSMSDNKGSAKSLRDNMLQQDNWKKEIEKLKNKGEA